MTSESEKILDTLVISIAIDKSNSEVAIQNRDEIKEALKAVIESSNKKNSSKAFKQAKKKLTKALPLMMQTQLEKELGRVKGENPESGGDLDALSSSSVIVDAIANINNIIENNAQLVSKIGKAVERELSKEMIELEEDIVEATLENNVEELERLNQDYTKLYASYTKLYATYIQKGGEENTLSASEAEVIMGGAIEKVRLSSRREALVGAALTKVEMEEAITSNPKGIEQERTDEGEAARKQYEKLIQEADQYLRDCHKDPNLKNLFSGIDIDSLKQDIENKAQGMLSDVEDLYSQKALLDEQLSPYVDEVFPELDQYLERNAKEWGGKFTQENPDHDFTLEELQQYYKQTSPVINNVKGEYTETVEFPYEIDGKKRVLKYGADKFDKMRKELSDMHKAIPPSKMTDFLEKLHGYVPKEELFNEIDKGILIAGQKKKTIIEEAKKIIGKYPENFTERQVYLDNDEQGPSIYDSTKETVTLLKNKPLEKFSGGRLDVDPSELPKKQKKQEPSNVKSVGDLQNQESSTDVPDNFSHASPSSSRSSSTHGDNDDPAKVFAQAVGQITRELNKMFSENAQGANKQNPPEANKQNPPESKKKKGGGFKVANWFNGRNKQKAKGPEVT